jgi:hypothetical protein
MTDWWAEFFWSRTQKAKAAFRRGYALGFLSALILVSIFGCTTIDQNNRVEGWPEMDIVEHKVSFDDVQTKCGAYVGWGQWPMACATFYFRQAKCVIWYAFDWSLEHERQHCLGFDHIGSNDMRAMLRDWRSR